MASFALQDYIGWAGDWAAGSAEQAGYNEQLADVISEGAAAGAVKAKSKDTSAQEVPLRLAVVGGPFSGKTSMALKLADDYGCKASSLLETVTSTLTGLLGRLEATSFCS